jgi:AcrR family transcriptional regulator
MLVRILDAAEQCIRRFGIRKTTLGEVARVGALSRGTIYRHFPDKAALIEGVLRRSQRKHLDRAEALLEAQDTLVDKVVSTVLTGREELGGGVYGDLMQTEPETVAGMFLEPGFYFRSVAFWPEHVVAAQERGEIAATVDVDTATDFIVRLAVSLVLFPDLGKSLRSRQQLKNYLRQVITSGLGEK